MLFEILLLSYYFFLFYESNGESACMHTDQTHHSSEDRVSRGKNKNADAELERRAAEQQMHADGEPQLQQGGGMQSNAAASSSAGRPSTTSTTSASSGAHKMVATKFDQAKKKTC